MEAPPSMEKPSPAPKAPVAKSKIQQIKSTASQAVDNTVQRLADVRQKLAKINRKSLVGAGAMAVRLALGPADDAVVVGAPVLMDILAPKSGIHSAHGQAVDSIRSPQATVAVKPANEIEEAKSTKPVGISGEPPKSDAERPLIVGQDGKPIGVLINGKAAPFSST